MLLIFRSEKSTETSVRFYLQEIDRPNLSALRQSYIADNNLKQHINIKNPKRRQHENMPANPEQKNKRKSRQLCTNRADVLILLSEWNFFLER